MKKRVDISLRAQREERRYYIFKVIVSVLLADRKIFVLAAHPFFLPKRHCPGDKETRRDQDRFEFEREWTCVKHPGWKVAPRQSGADRMADVGELGRDGYFIRSPYAETAHFLVVQKMLSRFQVLHCYMDAAQEMAASALVADARQGSRGEAGSERGQGRAHKAAEAGGGRAVPAQEGPGREEEWDGQ